MRKILSLDRPRNSDLTELLGRLEAATSRLEDIASSASSFEGSQPSHAHGSAAAAINRAASTASTSKQTAAPPSSASELEDLPESVVEFDNVVQNHLKPFLDQGNKLGGVVAEGVSQLHVIECTALTCVSLTVRRLSSARLS